MAPRKLADIASVELEPAEDVQAVCCSTGRELAREMDTLQRSLEKRDDWAERCRSLKRLQGLVMGSSHLEGFVLALLRLRELLLAQVTDLRSALVREACVALRLLAEAFGSEIEVLAAAALPVLLRSTSVTILVIAESCFRCACAIVGACQAPRVVQALLEPVSARSSVQRHRGLQVLLLALQSHPTERLERLAEPLQKAIRDGLEDAREEVRGSARQCFWAFTQKFEERGLRFLALLDPARQRQLKAEAPTGEGLRRGPGKPKAATLRARSAWQKRGSADIEAQRRPLADVTASTSQEKRRLLRSASQKLMAKDRQPESDLSKQRPPQRSSAGKLGGGEPESIETEPGSAPAPLPAQRLPSEPEAEPRGPEEAWAWASSPSPRQAKAEPAAEPKAEWPPSMEQLVDACLKGSDGAALVEALQPEKPQARPKASHALRALHLALLEANGPAAQLAAVELLDRLLTGSKLVRDAIADKCVAAPLTAALARCAVAHRAAKRVLGRWFVCEEPPPPSAPSPKPNVAGLPLRRGRVQPQSETEALRPSEGSPSPAALPSLTALLASRPCTEASTLRALAAAAKAEDEETWRSQGRVKQKQERMMLRFEREQCHLAELIDQSRYSRRTLGDRGDLCRFVRFVCADCDSAVPVCTQKESEWLRQAQELSRAVASPPLTLEERRLNSALERGLVGVATPTGAEQSGGVGQWDFTSRIWAEQRGPGVAVDRGGQSHVQGPCGQGGEARRR
eukprot:s9332_g1.t2